MTRFCCDSPVYADDIKAVKSVRGVKSTDAAPGPANPDGLAPDGLAPLDRAGSTRAHAEPWPAGPLNDCKRARPAIGLRSTPLFASSQRYRSTSLVDR
jgi:hypothetical protein